ncbi:hypothetical protein PtA15_4A813 [Puccinia triticina]|uniref:Uncharacterized protein n=1 Tax=Puccinia triticina TaxID=208348 RepID=A0ABY7CHX4_9BASI|nr:uncharacterized protein PtA15_4A813 [Puccinia triticina]WAQ84360.1 hypothetical protein PtA15_4A813 [Puccinia triticina]
MRPLSTPLGPVNGQGSPVRPPAPQVAQEAHHPHPHQEAPSNYRQLVSELLMGGGPFSIQNHSLVEYPAGGGELGNELAGTRKRTQSIMMDDLVLMGSDGKLAPSSPENATYAYEEDELVREDEEVHLATFTLDFYFIAHGAPVRLSINKHLPTPSLSSSGCNKFSIQEHLENAL